MIIRLPTIITAIIMAGAAGYTFDVKRGVIGLERELRDIRRETEEIEARTQGLMAEWARLNDVERLRSLADRHLAGLVAMQPVQLQRVDEAARRLPNPLAFAGPASPFLPRQETQLAEAPAVQPAQPEARPAPRALAQAPRSAAPTVVAAATPAAPPPVAAPAQPAPAQPAATAAPAPRRTAPVLPEAAPPPVAAPAQFAATPAPAPRRAQPEAARPEAPRNEVARAEPARPSLPPVAAPPVRDGAALPPVAAANTPIRPAMHVRPVETGSLLGGHSATLAPPVPLPR
ncbi:MAG: hypothetical protein NTW56_21490 [Alphaproteobacteria bacterium]|nr:hypothetical protein [Alphaproteobacteria bacterium]